MDGVIADFDKEHKRLEKEKGEKIHRPDLVVDFRVLDLIDGAHSALIRLNQDFDIYIASTPSWSRPETWGHKRDWIAKHFPWLKRKVILTHHKNLLKGDILIDDSRWRGQPDFEGTWFWFNKDWDNKNWKGCLEWIYKNKI
tara:strand:- start:619 stop:1041 length:423 start_codon:yes stop_codon:yes gene_type:complete